MWPNRMGRVKKKVKFVEIINTIQCSGINFQVSMHWQAEKGVWLFGFSFPFLAPWRDLWAFFKKKIFVFPVLPLPSSQGVGSACTIFLDWIERAGIPKVKTTPTTHSCAHTKLRFSLQSKVLAFMSKGGLFWSRSLGLSLLWVYYLWLLATSLSWKYMSPMFSRASRGADEILGCSVNYSRRLSRSKMESGFVSKDSPLLQ